MKLLLVFLLTVMGAVVSFAPLPAATPKRLFATSAGSDDAEQLRESAQKLRDEAKALESNLDRKPRAVVAMEPVAPSYTSLKESVWTLSYRFVSDPPKKDDDDDAPVSNYSGKLTVKLLSDGYTELIRHEPSTGDRLELLKVWGWDKEVSNEDDKDYVLFSTNIKVPESDVAMPNEELRFYWQARVESDSGGALSLADGTVTVKKDVEPPGGFWGIFNGGGILAQFRYVGNFAARSVSE